VHLIQIIALRQEMSFWFTGCCKCSCY